MEYLAAAYDGRREMLEAIFGKPDPEPPAPPALTVDAFDRMFP